MPVQAAVQTSRMGRLTYDLGFMPVIPSIGDRIYADNLPYTSMVVTERTFRQQGPGQWTCTIELGED